MHTLIEGALLAVIVVFMFLRDWRATLISSIALPLSVIPTFWVMSTMGFSLNLVSLLAITLVTGILVDDAIVEIENIVRHMRMGKSPYRAALEAADEIGLAVIAITFTIVAVFVPVTFMGGIAGRISSSSASRCGCGVVSLLVARSSRRCSPPISCGRQARGRARRLHHAGLYARSSAGPSATNSSRFVLGLGFFAARSVDGSAALRLFSEEDCRAHSSWSAARRETGRHEDR